MHIFFLDSMVNIVSRKKHGYKLAKPNHWLMSKDLDATNTS